MRTKLAIIFSIFTLFGFAGNISNNLSIPLNKKDLPNSSLVFKNEYEKEWKKVDFEDQGVNVKQTTTDSEK